MAKKKGKPQPRKSKKKRKPAFISSVKKMFLGAFAVVVCFIGALFIYNWFYPVSNTASVARKQDRVEADNQPKTDTRPKTTTRPKVSDKAASAAYTFPEKAEIPKLKRKLKEQVIQHEGYTVSYNSDYKIANWVAYELTSKEAKSKKIERSNKFVPDPLVKGASATNEDYTRSGYDRGHLAPAGDMKWSAKAMRESFYLSNICPQKPALNRGIWKELEEQSRLWATDYGALWIATGPVMADDMKRLGKNRVGVPKAFYKVICYVSGNEYKAIAFILENKDYKKTSLKSMAIPVDSVEKVTGIDFFPAVPDDQEKVMEAKIDWNSWSF